jgi:hypothetical protein
MLKVQVTINVANREELQKLINASTYHGYLRENPRLAWREKEHKEAIRYLVENLMTAELEKR